MSLDDAIYGTAQTHGISPYLTAHPVTYPETKDPALQGVFPARFFTLQWAVKAHPFGYLEWLMSRGHDQPHIREQFETYCDWYYPIVHETLRMRNNDK